MNRTTIVTGIWDIGRGELTKNWSRPFSHYLDHFNNLLKSPNNMIIFIPKEYRKFVEEKRDLNKTLIVERELDWFKSNIEIYDNIQKIRNNLLWYNQSGWLKDSTQAKLEMYNPLVMSKIFLLNDARILDIFNSTHLIWVDGALSHTVHYGYFWHDKVFDKIHNYFNKFSFVCFPYNGKTEIHGFEYKELCRIAGKNVEKVARGGIFGGPKDSIGKINDLYYQLLYDTLNKGYMGTEESIFTILIYLYPDLFNCFDIKEDGLLWPFFENLKNDHLKIKTGKISLYVIGYNSPSQFESLCQSFQKYDNNFIISPRKILLNNSIDKNTDSEYNQLCIRYEFEEIKKDNLGICGGRQFIAEHFDESDSDYYFFFEDDMLFYLDKDTKCRNGFPRKVDDLYNKCIGIIKDENLDFLKLNFSEFFGDNSYQWSWYNIPQHIKEKFWPGSTIVPFTQFNKIKIYQGLPYILGEIYYCNWPQIVSKSGNKKMFLDTKWKYPYEQTWMSHIYQLIKREEISSGVLLSSPTNHNRFEHYKASERKES